MTLHTRRMTMVVAALLLVAAGAWAQAGPPSAGPLDRLIDAAIADNPDLATLRSRIEVAEAGVTQAGSLPDPQGMIALSNLPVGDLSLERSPMTGIQLGLRQMIPYPGRLDLKELAAQRDVSISRAMYQEAENAVTREVKRTWHELYYLHRAVEVARLNKRLAEALTQVADALYSTGSRPQQDLIKANVEVARLVDRLVVLEELIDRSEARLNGLLNRPPDAPLPAPEVSFEPLDLSAQALEGVALESRPLLLEAQAGMERAEIMVRLARMNLKPDFTVGFDYRIRAGSAMDPIAGQDMWSLSVGANLPWLNQDLHEAERDQADAMLDAAQQQQSAMRNRVREALDNALESAQKSRRQASLYAEGLIPEAELAFSAARSAYETGMADMTSVLDTFRTLNGYQESYYRIVADHQNAVADLEYVIGQRLR